MRSLLYALLTLSALGIASAPVSAAELTSPPAAERSKMPPGADFSNGPTGGGAQLIGTDHIPTSAEFSNGPTGISQE